ncbi:MAG: flagellar export chaperone FliS [Fimbriimonadaceae bacterium]|nr:flagellar export chaperone FliS [Fimbriimonadaceae bacterium]QYK56785.1 MAG: flagellar export chaperone FliS [Fimbriimonadaceae bacterium]
MESAILAYGSSHLDTYRKTAIEGATPLGLVVMLYDGAFRFIEAGRQAMRKEDAFAQNQALQKAQKIVSELMACLDMEKGGEVAQNLFALYAFCYDRLVMANIERREEALDETVHVLSQLREAWSELDLQTRKGGLEQRAA